MNKRRKNQGLLRLFIQCLSFAFHNGYVRGWMKGKIYTGNNKMFCVPGLNCYSCPGALGSCPIGSLQAVLDSGKYRVSLYVMGFIGAVGMFCGRFVCGWLCPFGLVQDLIYKIPFIKKFKNMPGHKLLKYLRYVILVLFVLILPMAVKNQSGVGSPWFCEYICPSGTLLGGIPLTIANATLRAQIGPRFMWKVFLLILVILFSLTFYRPFCKYVCPLGALYGLCNPVSIYRYKVDEDACVSCGACKKACGMDIEVWKKPNSMDCIRCGKCIAACPKDAISTTFTLKKVKPVNEGSGIPAAADLRKKNSAAVIQKANEAADIQPADDKANIQLTDAVNNPQAVNAESNPQAVSDENTAQVGDDEVSSDTSKKMKKQPRKKQREMKEAGTGKRIFSAIMGLLCLGVAVAAFYVAYAMVKSMILTGSIDDAASIAHYTLGSIIACVPGIMTGILGGGLIISVGKKELYNTFRTWPKKVLGTMVKSIIITYILSLILCVILVKMVDIGFFMVAMTFMLYAFYVYIPMLIVLLLTWAVTR